MRRAFPGKVFPGKEAVTLGQVCLVLPFEPVSFRRNFPAFLLDKAIIPQAGIRRNFPVILPDTLLAGPGTDNLPVKIMEPDQGRRCTLSELAFPEKDRSILIEIVTVGTFQDLTYPDRKGN